jgi:hypothetical protein
MAQDSNKDSLFDTRPLAARHPDEPLARVRVLHDLSEKIEPSPSVPGKVSLEGLKRVVATDLAEIEEEIEDNDNGGAGGNETSIRGKVIAPHPTHAQIPGKDTPREPLHPTTKEQRIADKVPSPKSIESSPTQRLFDLP